jgi:hypothetical protein
MTDNRIYSIVNRLTPDAIEKKKRHLVDIISNEFSPKPPIKVLKG